MLKNSGVSLIVILMALAPAPIARAQEQPAYAVAGSAVHEVRTSSGRAYKLFVKTPPGYSEPENAARRYPAVFVNDGQLFFLVAAGAPLLSYYNKTLDEVIIIGVSYALGEDPIASRQRDLTPVVDDNFKNETGGAADYLAFITESVVPLIERGYRTDPSRRTLVGHSFGGTFGAYAMLNEPGRFANYILISPALWFGDHAIAAAEEEYAKANHALPARVYMAVGDLEGPRGGLKNVDLVNDQIAFAARLRSRNYQEFVLRNEVLGAGVSHSTSFPTGFLRALEWMFPPQ